MKAAGYIRCSTEQQEDSPEQQKNEILAFAARSGFAVSQWFEDFGKSGTTFDQRPGFQRMKAMVEAGASFNVVICYDESRWGRAIDAEENSYWRMHFKRHGVSVILVKTSVDPNHEFAPMLKSFEGVLASQYSKKLSELTLRGQQSNGRFSSGGTAPYGYRRVAANLKSGVERTLQDGDWCVKKQEKVYWETGDVGEVDTVRLIFEQRAKGIACVVIAKMLNDAGVTCARRGKWRNKNRKWSSGTIASILRNPAYYGARAYNRISSSKIIASKRGRQLKHGHKAPVWQNDKSEWVVTEGAHPAIVSKELWDKANVAGRRRTDPLHKPRFNSRYLLTGLIHCSKCGFAFQGWSGKVNGKEYLRYIDGGWQSKRVCDFLSIPRDYLEEYALSAVRETLSDTQMLSRIEAYVQDLFRVEPSAREQEHIAATEGIVSTERKIRNLLQIIEDGVQGAESVRHRLAELEKEREDHRQTLRRHEAGDETRKVRDIAGLVTDFVHGFEEEFKRAPQEERKIMVQKCIANIVIDREASVARFHVRRIPAVTPEIEKALNPDGNEGSCVSCRSARNRT